MVSQEQLDRMDRLRYLEKEEIPHLKAKLAEAETRVASLRALEKEIMR